VRSVQKWSIISLLPTVKHRTPDQPTPNHKTFEPTKQQIPGILQKVTYNNVCDSNFGPTNSRRFCQNNGLGFEVSLCSNSFPLGPISIIVKCRSLRRGEISAYYFMRSTYIDIGWQINFFYFLTRKKFVNFNEK
jgi:hypothetical protein